MTEEVIHRQRLIGILQIKIEEAGKIEKCKEIYVCVMPQIETWAIWAPQAPDVVRLIRFEIAE